MAVISFDTLKHVERLTAAGVPDAQARAEASALRDVLAESLDTTIATKGDVARLEANTKASISSLEASTKASISSLEAATKADSARLDANISSLEASTKASISSLAASTKADMELQRKDMQAMELRLVIKLGALMTAIAGLGITAMKLLH